ncbi:hypothetical protein RJZ56_007199 [Blastomyces dermatitidis]|uniref:Lanthionine synthetase C family protein n=1 Tax=Ajellomyces dermatitidis (strain ER-3 / ATCC MYA-2586) TaxID=559297 RepID=A0ABP2ERD3_AJEDR|nr:lanthionine synthetase C family protein [Blastomyces dermatitidis ER-3]EEQ85007.1 lanthionine synthetase C family protein [Blastomyces dermatitidis ER-3]
MAPQYYENQLDLITLDDEVLHQVLRELQGAVKRATDIIKINVPEPLPDDKNAFGSIYNGTLGVALMFLRLQQQASYVEDGEEAPRLASGFYERAYSRISYSVSETSHLRPGRLSPLGSSTLGACVLRVSAALAGPTLQKASALDIDILKTATEFAIKQGTVLGGDEALYGRAGLLLALLQIRQQCKDEENTAALTPVFTMIPRLVTIILESGRVGATDYEDAYGDQDVLPLMWPWHNKYYLGAIHGIAGILSVLLACKPDELDDGTINHLPIIAETISGLCKLTIENGGDLPSSLPIRSSSRYASYVQICHGSPGMLILLAQARNSTQLMRSFWEPDWDKAIRIGSRQVWERGLLFKGGGICHGIAGNAWPLLLLHDSFEYGNERTELAKLSFKDRTGSDASAEEELTPDYFLSRALTLLLYARKTPPFHHREFRDEREFRLPDTPYSLFEGLAGTCATWGEACVVIKARLRKQELVDKSSGISSEEIERDELLSIHLQHELGFPGLTLGGLR